MTIFLTKILIFLLRLRGGGSSLPGKFALRLNKRILTKLAQGWQVILVTGTNGKTTTSDMVYKALIAEGFHVMNNSAGANMTPGIVSTFAKHHKFGDRRPNRYAVIEVDEAYMREVTSMITPEMIVVTNIFRDQLDRFGETTTTYKFILDAIKNVPSAKLILNGDESMLGNMPVSNDCVYLGFENYGEAVIAANTESIFCRDCKTRYEYESVVFNHLGAYRCPKCGHARPKLDYGVTDVMLSPKESTFLLNGDEVTVGVPGLYNIYNATTAYVVADQLGLDRSTIKNSLATQESKFGRFEKVTVGERDMRLLLIKNPAGCNQCIDTVAIDQDEVSLLFLLNDKYADGTDVSWIYDAHFEKLAAMNVSKVIIGGDRAYDMAIRLKVAGLDRMNFTICKSYDEVLEAVAKQERDLYVFMTYTAMTSFRGYLVDKGLAKKI
ncbi:MAG: MurT ligase domain-containing protein [Turicibacter sp.]|nr:MurT ligase domain-containing protein [Turicibacter sp.]